MIPAAAHGQDEAAAPPAAYQRPSAPIARAVEAEGAPLAFVSPDAATVALLSRAALPPIAELARPELGLAGEQIDPATNGPSRGVFFDALRFVDTASGGSVAVRLPQGAAISAPRWSPDGRRLAFLLTTDDSAELWIADTRDGAARRLAGRLNAAFPNAFVWLPDGSGFIVRQVPEGRGPAPERPRVPVGPVIREADGNPVAVQTLANLLRDRHDDALFIHYFTSQLAVVPLSGGPARPIGAPGLIRSVQVSPDGRYLLIERLKPPFSRTVGASGFAADVLIWDVEGRLVRRLADRPAADERAYDSGAPAPGPRAIAWRTDAPATLVWAEFDRSPQRDRVLLLPAPFDTPPKLLAEIDGNYVSMLWGRPDLAIMSVHQRGGRATVQWRIDPARANRMETGGQGARLLPPGTEPLTRADGRGGDVAAFSPHGDLLVVRAGRVAKLSPGQAPRTLWTIPSSGVQRLAQIDAAHAAALVWRESRSTPPNLFRIDLASGKARQLTHFDDPAPFFAGIERRRLVYRRADGVPLGATLYLPPAEARREKGPLPAIFWAYPVVKDAATYRAPREEAPKGFVRPHGLDPLLLAADGYAVLIPDMPILRTSEGIWPGFNDQLVANAQAAIGAAVATGQVDRGRIAVAGHSFGAAMVANLLAHSDLFRTGIALSGAYNRTLTPFGFQTERRNFWEAPEEYLEASAFIHADRIAEPLLLIHGADDPNSGAQPMQSERLFAALRGLGGRARYVLLPAEGHSYTARESVLHALWEIERWLAVNLNPPGCANVSACHASSDK